MLRTLQQAQTFSCGPQRMVQILCTSIFNAKILDNDCVSVSLKKPTMQQSTIEFMG